MKKTLLLLASTALLLVGCAKEQVGPGAAGDGEMVEVDITAGTAELTKAAIDKDGQAAYVTRWIMEVRDGSGAVYSRKEATEVAGTLQHKFNIKLFKNQQYTFAFWADNGGEFYDASDLSAVKYVDGKSVVAGADAKDAFSGVETLTFSQSISKTIVLHRPFAQLNVITKDLKDLRADAISDDAYNAFKPKNFKTTITVPTQFDVLTGEASVETELILAADDFYGKSPLSYEDAPKQATMFMAYIFASKDEKDVRNVNFKFDVDSQTGNNTFDFTDVPFQRNYRTNILGNFLSGDAEWTVQIDTVWSGEYDYPPFEAGSIAEANASLAAGETNISITDPSDYASVDLTIPAVANGKDLIIEVADNAGMELKVDASNSTPKSISLAAVKATSLNIDAPATHVELTKGVYTNVEAKTSATTLVVGKNTTITNLTIKKGNAVIAGNVTTFVNETDATLVWNVANTAEFANAVKFAGEGDEIKVAAGNYTMPTKIEKNNITVTGVGGAVLECPSTCEISSDNISLKGITFNYKSSITGNYGALYVTSNALLENCQFTGGVDANSNIVVVGGAGTVDFKGCRFENAGKGRGIKVWGGTPTIKVDGCYFDNIYPFNVDGGNPTFNFTNSTLNGWSSWGKGNVSLVNCEFGKSTSGYAYCRPYQNTVFTGCNFCEGYLVDFGAEGIEIDLNGCKLNGQPMTIAILDIYDLSNSGILRIDGKEVFPISNFEVSTADELKAAVELVNGIKKAGEYSIILSDGNYEVSDMAIAENVNGKTVIIKAANEGQVTLKMNADTKSKQIFLVDGYSGNYSSYRLVIDGFKFDLTAVTSGTAAPVYAFQAGDGLASTIRYTTKGPNLRYAHHITIQNCELVGAQNKENAMMFYSQNDTSPNNVVVKDSKVVNAGYLFSGYCDTFTATNVTATNVKHFVNNQGNGITVENCTVDCYTDYAIRANAGPVSITGSKFVMTYNGSDKGGIYVDRGNNTQLTMTGNTYPASYSGANMHDVYNEKGGPCIISNGSQVVKTLENGETYDFPRE